MAHKGQLKEPVQFIKGVGPSRARLLKRLGIQTVRDALMYFPMRYEDRAHVGKIAELKSGALVTARGKVVSRKLIRTPRRRMSIVELVINDGTGLLAAKWFNQPFMKNRFKEGQEVILSGLLKTSTYTGAPELDNPSYEFPTAEEEDSLIHTSRIVPVYRTTEGLSARQLRSVISSALKEHIDGIEDPVPEEILKRCSLPGLFESVMKTHLPDEDSDIAELNRWQSPYQMRLSFEELFMLQLGFASLKKRAAREPGISFKPKGGLCGKLLKLLPFKLTAAQLRVTSEIGSDMARPEPMNRLLQGDVGSGKTVVALMAMLGAVECGHQAALMAPTELLAEQHYINIHRLVEALGLRIALITGSTKERPLGEIASGEIKMVLGTHALIQESVVFKSLGLAVIDEQHRFGVLQRALLRKKSATDGRNPDMLIMTATPIPRTLAMTAFGDLSYSVIDELPPGRTPVDTVVLNEDRKSSAYEMIQEELKTGGQVYVVYPVIEGSETLNLKSVLDGAAALEKRFPKARVGLIHGRMGPAEREHVMSSFKAADIDILASTTVIEVGVDVPNASLMLVVHAERFGLSQLHQLRGRVGRGRRKSRCVLIAYSPLGEDARIRLKTMAMTTDGFVVAEEDLKLRGPGEVAGTRQSGLPDLRVANILRDAYLLEMTRKEAFNLIDSDPTLRTVPALRDAVEAFWKDKTEIFKTA